MEAHHLARFDPGLTWEEIVQLNGLGKRWWREAVTVAEHNGWLRWKTAKGKQGRWTLTDEGREWIASQANGKA